MPNSKKFTYLGSGKHKFVDVDPDRCMGCGICELVCSFEKSNMKEFNPQKSRIRVLRLRPTINVAMTCRLCENPPCVRACPRNALIQSEENGVILVSEDKCDGCGWCIKACDYGSITIDPSTKIAFACDLCRGRKGSGVFPGRKIVNQSCIEWCPEEALDLVTGDGIAQKSREKAATKLFSDNE